MKLLIELDEECIKAIDKIKFLIGGRTDQKLQLEIIKAIKNGKPIEQEPRVDFKELKRKILMEVDGGTDDAWLAYGEVCNRISNSIDEFVADMRGEEE